MLLSGTRQQKQSRVTMLHLGLLSRKLNLRFESVFHREKSNGETEGGRQWERGKQRPGWIRRESVFLLNVNVLLRQDG